MEEVLYVRRWEKKLKRFLLSCAFNVYNLRVLEHFDTWYSFYYLSDFWDILSQNIASRFHNRNKNKLEMFGMIKLSRI